MTSTTTNATIDSGTDFSTMAEEFAKRLEWKINDDNHESQNINNVVSSIIRQVSGKKIWIFLHQLLEIVKPEIQQDIINSIANSDISRRNRTSYGMVSLLQAFVPASCSLPRRSFVLEKYGCHKNAEVLPQQLYKRIKS
ncbi:18053_t:CDS:2 [Gigaspora rosea]|nr:18053_t:CDS:2 [Gigaspora rosea]